MQTGLKDRVALIAGASQGLGRAAALGFASEGCHLALCSRNIAALNGLAETIRRDYHIQVHTDALDVSDSAAVTRFADETVRMFDRLDVCVANAGGPPAKHLLETNDDDWDSAFQLNLRSAAGLARAVIPHMQRRKWGRFITISSITVREPQPPLILSNAIRTGILGLVRTLATEFGPSGILVNNVAPGYTATDRLNELIAHRATASHETKEQIEKQWVDEIPLGRLGRPEEVADAIVWLASERASFITGQTVLVDGGMYKGL